MTRTYRCQYYSYIKLNAPQGKMQKSRFFYVLKLQFLTSFKIYKINLMFLFFKISITDNYLRPPPPSLFMIVRHFLPHIHLSPHSFQENWHDHKKFCRHHQILPCDAMETQFTNVSSLEIFSHENIFSKGILI